MIKIHFLLQWKFQKLLKSSNYCRFFSNIRSKLNVVRLTNIFSCYKILLTKRLPNLLELKGKMSFSTWQLRLLRGHVPIPKRSRMSGFSLQFDRTRRKKNSEDIFILMNFALTAHRPKTQISQKMLFWL